MTQKLHTPDHVAWGTIINNPNKQWPKPWIPVGHPHPVPGGALIVIKSYSGQAHRNLFTIMSWAFDGTVDIVKIGDDPAMYIKSQQARDAVTVIAKRLREAMPNEDAE